MLIVEYDGVNCSKLRHVRTISASKGVFADNDEALATTEQGITCGWSFIYTWGQHRRQLSGRLQFSVVISGAATVCFILDTVSILITVMIAVSSLTLCLTLSVYLMYIYTTQPKGQTLLTSTETDHLHRIIIIIKSPQLSC